MPAWLEVVLVVLCVGLAWNNIELRNDLNLTNKLYQITKDSNQSLAKGLKEAKKQIAELKGETENHKIPAFLLADDPMDELLKDVGRVDW